MNNVDTQYLDLLNDVLINGLKRDDRTGVGTIGVFGRQLRFDLRKNFPLLTTKQVPWKGIVSELLWFIEGSRDERRLAELRYGKNAEELVGKTTIWTENAEAPYWKPKAQFEGDLGRIYGVQWRDWQSPVAGDKQLREVRHIDQLSNLITGIKKDPYGRRHILTAWNPGELDQMALPPCHMLAQFDVRNGELSCLMTQRSADLFLGIPFNIASYSLFTLMIAHTCNLNPGDFILSLGDVHIYMSHLDAVEEQLRRKPLDLPTVSLNPDIKNIDEFKMSDIILENYISHPAIKAKMAV